VLASLCMLLKKPPEFGADGERVPLGRFVAEAEDAVLCAGLRYVAAGAPDGDVELVLRDGREETGV